MTTSPEGRHARHRETGTEQRTAERGTEQRTAEQGTEQRTVEQGTAALERLCHQLGLDPEQPEVISNRGSLLLRMPSAGLIARVSTHTGWQRVDPGWWLGTEVHAGRLAQRAGVPAAVPASAVDPGPHQADGLWLSLWEDLGDDDSQATPEQAAQALADWHRGLATHTAADLPLLPMVHHGITEPLEYAARHGQLTDDTLAALTAEHAEALGAVAGALEAGATHLVLHGDAHRGNLHRDRFGTWRWIDLEEACRGPVEWDLAVLGTSDEGEATLAAYCRITGRPVPSPEELAPWLRLRRLEAVAWFLGCAVTFPERYADPAREWVGHILAERA